MAVVAPSPGGGTEGPHRAAPCLHPSVGVWELHCRYFCPFQSPAEINHLASRVWCFQGFPVWVDVGWGGLVVPEFNLLPRPQAIGSSCDPPLTPPLGESVIFPP